MALIVQKFGGTSVADAVKIQSAARKAIRAVQEGHQVVMVVSAMGKQTDELIALARQVSERPPAREMDMLLSTGEQVSVALMAMAIDAMGYQAISLTGAQIGIKTDSTHTKARIQSISTERMREALDAGRIVIAAGFQGIDENFNITTLGRGGSDTTAVALAAVLQADACEIYTDVDGVYTTDPRVLPEARKMASVSYDEMLELASLGAGVMHSRSIEFAKKFHVPIHVRSSFSDQPGSIIHAQPEAPGLAVSGATVVKQEARVTIEGVPDRPGVSLAIFSQIAARNIAVDMIVQNIGEDQRADISFTVLRDELRPTLEALQPLVAQLGPINISHDENLAKVSVVGLGMATQTGVAQKMFRALAEQSVNLQMITTSEIKISVLVSRDDALGALRTVHRAFELEKSPPDATPVDPRGVRPTRSDAVAVIRRLQRMEDLAIDDVALDDTQALVTVRRLPDRPGIAAALFDQIAAAGIFVDMIVQSFGREGKAHVSFTVPQADLKRAVQIAEQLARDWQCGPVAHNARIAKLSVSGIGLRSHTGVAIRMFRALAEAGINVEIISTSEVRVNVVVAGTQGAAALAALQAAFADVLPG